MFGLKEIVVPGFRNVVVHEYVALDMDRVVEALHDLTAVERFASVVAEIERLTDPTEWAAASARGVLRRALWRARSSLHVSYPGRNTGQIVIAER